MRTFWQDLRYGARTMRRSPAVTAVAILALALGIGANTAIFTVVDAVLLRPLPFADTDRLVTVWETYLPSGQGTASAPDLKDWRQQNQAFEDLAGHSSGSFTLLGREGPERVQGAAVSAGFFQIFRVQPVAGRLFAEGEDQPAAPRVVVLSERLWRNRFGGNPDILGKPLTVNGESYTVAGIAPASFVYPSRGTQLWVPLVFNPQQAQNRGSHWIYVVGRLLPDQTLETAHTQMDTIARRLEEQYPRTNTGRGVRLVPLREQYVQGVRKSLLILLGAVGFLLFIACANVANLLLARAAARAREVSIRAALGAGRRRLVRQFLTESLLLAATGGGLGILLAWWGVDALSTLAPGNLPRLNAIALNGRVLFFTALLSFVTTLVFGLAPALVAASPARAAAPSRDASRPLVVTEVALALVLLIGASLLIQSFWRLLQVDPGFRPQHVLSMTLALPEGKYPDTAATARFHRQALERIAALPGVQVVGLINALPLQVWGINGDFQIAGRPPFPARKQPNAEYRAASPDYFTALGVPLLQGRAFTEQDRLGAPLVAIINREMARAFFSGESPLGQQLIFDGPEGRTIVGVIGDVHQADLGRRQVSEIYVPYGQSKQHFLTASMSLVVRSSGDPTNLTAAIRREILAIDPAQPVFNVKTMQKVVDDSLSPRRFQMTLLAVFAAVALLLADIGIYGVLYYWVRRRTREIGIRMALGAQRRDVVRAVVGQAFLLASLGILLGLAASYGLTRFLAGFLYGLQPTDIPTFAAVSTLLLAVALAAGYFPARRAAAVDPMEALRHE